MDSKKTPLKNSYRPDIDGLRAIAVLAVLFFHAFPKRLPGGFIGVDVFFVISGYLITSIMLKDFQNNQFSIITFYSKRIKRIFPGLALVLASTIAIAWFTLLPAELEELGKHVASGVGFVANFILWKETGYFNTASELKPLLHLWSLAVEEQYYIFWPIFLALFWNKKRAAIILVAAILLISFVINISMLKYDPSGAFYSPLSRFWEIIIGAALAFYQNDKKDSTELSHAKNSILNFLQSFLGLSLITYSIIRYSEAVTFPGWHALPATIGTMLVINTSSSSFINSKILSNKCLVFIGLISYPLYLWHWPLITLARITNEGVTRPSIQASILLISFVLSILTYFYVEQPFKTKRESGILKHASAMLLITMLGLGTLGFAIYKNKGLPNRSVLYKNPMEIIYWSLDIPGTKDCIDTFTKVKDSFCRTSPTPNVAIIGDSHSGAIYTGFINSKNVFYNQAIVLGAGTCQPTLGLEERAGCNEQLNSALNIVNKNQKLTTVVLTSYYLPLAVNDPKIINKYMLSYSKTLDLLIKNKKKIIVMLDTPTLEFDPFTCIKRRPFYLTQDNLRSECSFTQDIHNEKRKYYNLFMNNLAVKYPKVIFYNPADVFYQNEKYWAIINNELLYADFNHLSPAGAKKVVSSLINYTKK